MVRKTVLILLAGAALPINAAWAQTSPSSESSAESGEIIVTAQKISQRAQDVPLAVAAVDGKKLEQYGVSRLQDIAATLPGLQVDSYSGVPGVNTITLRGITTGQQASSTVATYIDDVPVGASNAFASGSLFSLDLFPYDLDHVEVLGGPQGTLYGASSLGGLVKYVTRTPSLKDDSYQFGGELLGVNHGSKAGWTARGAAGVVVVPGELAVSISGAHQYTPGFINNPATGQKDVNHGALDSVRGVIFWKPSDPFDLKLTGLYNQSDFKDIGLVSVSPSGVPLFGRYSYFSAQPNGQKSTTKLGSATAGYDFGFAKLTSITSYSDFHNISAFDASSVFGPIFGVDAVFANNVKVKKFTEEVRLASPAEDRFHWMLGTFYTRERTSFNQLGSALVPGTRTPATGLDPLLNGLISARYREWAIFANATFKITDAWDISGGARYSENKQSVNEVVSGVLAGPGFTLADRRSSDHAVTFSASSSYHFTPDVMAYARVASGYRPGGPNFAIPGIPDSYEPDKLTNYEAGLKSMFFDRRLLLNVSAFYIDWRNIQLSGTSPTNLQFVANGGKASSKGVEVTGNLRIAPGLSLGGALAYTATKLKDSAPVVGGVAGDRLPLTPRWAGSITADYRTSLSDKVDGHAGLVWRYSGSRHQYFPANALDHNLGSYNTLNASAGITYDMVNVNLFVRNLTNSYDYNSWQSPLGPAVLTPRTIGLSVDFKLR